MEPSSVNVVHIVLEATKSLPLLIRKLDYFSKHCKIVKQKTETLGVCEDLDWSKLFFSDAHIQMQIFLQENKYFAEKKRKNLPIFSNKTKFRHEAKLLVIFYLSSNIVDW